MELRKVIIINGPNLNLLGIREPDKYGYENFEVFFNTLNSKYKDQFDLTYFQSNIEGVLIDKLQETGFEYDAILLNAGGYTHTSVALRDCIAAIKTNVVEVHITNIYAREEFRHHSLLSAVCQGVISGFGLNSYELALNSLE